MRNLYPFLFVFFFTQQAILAQKPLSFVEFAEAFQKANSDTAKLRVLFSEKPVKYTDHANELLKFYKIGYALARKHDDKVNRFKAIHYTALTYLYGKTDESTAFIWLQKALSEAEYAQNNLFIGWVYYAMSIIHHHQNDRPAMYKAQYKAINYMEKAPDPSDGPFIALSQNLEDDKRWNEQLAVNKRLVVLMERTKANLFESATSYNSLVDALKHHPDKLSELKYYQRKTLSILDKIDSTTLYPDDILIVASIYYKYNHFEKAVKYANQIASLSDTSGFILSVRGTAYKFLADLYEEKKNYKLALENFKNYQNIENQQIIKRLTDDAGNKIIKAEAERDVAIKQQEVEQQQFFTYWSIAITLLVVLIASSIYYFYRREQTRKTELQNLNTTKDKLFAILSHDLRSPIMGLKNYLMLINWGALSQREFEESAQSLTSQLGNVYDMLENVLNWAVSQLGGLHPQKETIAILPIVEEQLQLLHSNAAAKSITINIDIAPHIQLFIDKNHLAVIIRNLLQNAIKFTPTGGGIFLTHRSDKKWNYVEIKDTGMGMSEEIVQQLFRLGKKHSRAGTANETGTGLGLMLVKELVEANDGRISATSQPNEGSTFTVCLKKS